MPAEPTTPSTKTKSAGLFKEAISIDPDYLEARSSYAGALLDAGDMDEAIRQLNVVTQRDPKKRHGLLPALAGLCAQERLRRCIQAARQAILLTPGQRRSAFLAG
jgi:predicted Zn-dependent protease